MSALRELYQEIILDHNKSPRNYFKMEDATRKVEAYNPLCGDHYTIYVRMVDDHIAAVSFMGSGCAISKASASVMSSIVVGKSRDEVQTLFSDFVKLVKGELDVDQNIDRLGKLAAFAGVSEFPARVKCASLAWHTLHAAVDSDQTTISTE
jgi:nitrogen fixation protein NifU and related proteins